MGGGGGQIAFASDRTGTVQIYLINADGSNLVQVTDVGDRGVFDIKLGPHAVGLDVQGCVSYGRWSEL